MSRPDVWEELIMNESVNNEKKLLRNIDTIIVKYMKVNDKLLETLADDDDHAFKEQAVLASSDHFLDGIIDNYQDFTFRLKERLKEIHKTDVDKIQQKKLTEFKKTGKKKTTTRAYQRRKVQIYARKGQKMKWSRKEQIIVNRGVRSGSKPAQIRLKINAEREKDGELLRSYQSVASKTYRTRKQNDE